MNKTKIEWTDYTWNPVTGCLHDCPYCYARKITKRFKQHYPGGFLPTFHPDRLGDPEKIKKPSKIFVVSMGDLFGAWVPYEWQRAVFEVVDKFPQHTFQFLTKNPEGMCVAFIKYWGGVVPNNVWFGQTVTKLGEEQPFDIDGGTAFISYEPLLGNCLGEDDTIVDYFIPDWIIIGAQTNPFVRPDDLWVQEIIDVAYHNDIPVFLKDSIQSYWPKRLRDFPEVGV